jgi:hypothetical protein
LGTEIRRSGFCRLFYGKVDSINSNFSSKKKLRINQDSLDCVRFDFAIKKTCQVSETWQV